MSEHWIVYRDVLDFPRREFEVIRGPKPEERIVKEQTIPAAYGFPPMYIRRHRFVVHGVIVNLITYTEKELSKAEAVLLAAEGLQHVHER